MYNRVETMQRSGRVIRAAAFTAALLLLLAAGVYLYPRKLRPYDEIGFMRPRPAEYQGVLNVWQVNDWRVGGYSRTNLVQGAAQRYEKNNIGVFVEFRNVTPEQLAAFLASGEKPDVVSFPDGFAGLPAEGLLDLSGYELPPLKDPFRRAFARESRAVPWMGGGQFVLTNSEVGRAVAVEPPQADNTWTAQALLEYAERAATGRRKKPVTALCGAVGLMESLAVSGVRLDGLAAKSLLPDKAYGMTIDQARSVYTTGKCALLLCTQWEGALMGRLAAKNKAFDYTLLPWPADLRPCLSVQFAAALDSGSAVKNRAEAAFIATLLSPAVQKDVANKACSLAVVSLPEEDTPQGEIEKMLLDQLPVGRVPLPFVAIDADAVAAALGGDAAAAERLKGRFVN
jgi:ABC-type glycerol-3-phosphate transport system substrate-binding protein